MSDPTNPPAAPPTGQSPPVSASPAPATSSPAAAVPLTEYERATARVRELEAALQQQNARDAETKATLAKLNETVALTQKERDELAATRRAERITAGVRMAAVEAGAVDPDDVVALVSSRFTLSETGAVITADDTKATVAAYVADYLTKKPHLARPRIAQGSGAAPFPGTAPAAPTAPSFRDDPNAWLQAQFAQATAPATNGGNAGGRDGPR